MVRTTATNLSGALVATLFVAGCATSTGAGGPDRSVKQADERLPAAASFYDEPERSLVEDAHAHQAAARKLVEDGDPEKAHVEFAAAAERYARFADTYGASRWRIAFRYRAAEDLLFAQQPDRAAAQADKVLADPDANARSRAMAAYLSALAWRNVAVQREKAGEIAPIQLATVEQRAGAPLAKRAPAEPWARFIAAVDALLPIWGQHPDAAKLFSQRNFALTAAQVSYACDDMADAQRRLETVISSWPSELDVMEHAVPLLLETFLVSGDDAGFGAAAEKMKQGVDAQLAKVG